MTRPQESLLDLPTEEQFIAVYLLVDRFLQVYPKAYGPLRSSPNTQPPT